MIRRSLEFVKWPKLLVWHIATKRGATVCGLPLPSPSSEGMHVTRPWSERFENLWRRTKGNRVCRSCDRMKDAETMRLR